jgi:hypothetical protein
MYARASFKASIAAAIRGCIARSFCPDKVNVPRQSIIPTAIPEMNFNSASSSVRLVYPYFTKTVTSDWLVLPAIVTTTFCGPAGVSAGNVILN